MRRSTRAWSWRSGGQPRARPGERRAAPRDARGARRSSTRSATRRRRRRRCAHSHPSGSRELWWAQLGPERRGRADAARQRAGRERGAREHAAHDAATSASTRWPRRASRARADAGRCPEAVVLEEPYDVHGSGAVRARRADAAVARLDAGRARARPAGRASGCSTSAPRPGAKTTHLAALMGDEGEVVAVERDPRRAEASCRATPQRLGVAMRRRRRRGRDATRPTAAATTACWSIRPARTSARSSRGPDARWRKQPAAGRGAARAAAADPRRRRGGGAARRPARLLHLHHQRGRERGPDAAFLARHPDFALRPIGDVSGPERTAGGSFKLCPTAMARTGSSSQRSSGMDDVEPGKASPRAAERNVRPGPRVPRLRRAVAAPDAARRAATAASTACSASS